jgi:hypothetical protein
MWSLRLILPTTSKVKIRAPHLLLVLALAALAVFFTGCASTEPDNASVRPWNSPEGWQGGALDGLMDQQHR